MRSHVVAFADPVQIDYTIHQLTVSDQVTLYTTYWYKKVEKNIQKAKVDLVVAYHIPPLKKERK